MTEEEIEETLEKLGYKGERMKLVRGYVREFQRRMNVVAPHEASMSDVVLATLVYDAYLKLYDLMGAKR